MADGTRRAIGDVVAGDRLVDEDGEARTITGCSVGEGQLYKVTYSNGLITENATSFTCNGGHQLVVYFGFGVFLQAQNDANHVVAMGSTDVTRYVVLYHRLLADVDVGFTVPINTSRSFLVDEDVFEFEENGQKQARLAAEAHRAAWIAAGITKGIKLTHLVTKTASGYRVTIQPGDRPAGMDYKQATYYYHVSKGQYFRTLAKARAAAEAFAATVPAHLMWQPTVTQYRAFLERYPNREQWCRMLRCAPDKLPLPSPFLTFSSILAAAYDSVAAAGGAVVAPPDRITPADAAYLVGLWLGDGHKARACIYMQKPDDQAASPLGAIRDAAPKMGLETQVLELASEEVGGGMERARPYYHVYLSTATGIAVASATKRRRLAEAVGGGAGGDAAAGATLLRDEPAMNLFVHLLTALGMFGADHDKPVSLAAEQAFVRDSLAVRASLLAGLIDTDGSRRGAGWILWQKDADDATGQQFHLPIAQLVWRTALSLGFASSISRNQKTRAPSGEEVKKAVVRITSPAGDGDILSPLLRHSYKRVSPVEPEDPKEKRWLRGQQFCRFTIASAAVGPYVSVQVDGPNHRFLLADYLVAHNCEEYGRMLQVRPLVSTHQPLPSSFSHH